MIFSSWRSRPEGPRSAVVMRRRLVLRTPLLALSSLDAWVFSPGEGSAVSVGVVAVTGDVVVRKSSSAPGAQID